MNGWITIGTKLSTDKFDRQIQGLENKIDREERKKIEIQAEVMNIQKKVNDYNELVQKAEEYREKIRDLAIEQQKFESSQGTKSPQLAMQIAETRKEYENMKADIDKNASSMDKLAARGNSLIGKHKELTQNVEQYKTRIEEIKLQKQQAQIARMKDSFSNIGKKAQGMGSKLKESFGGASNSLQTAIGKAAKLVLGIFAIRSAFMAVRRASSELAQYDKQYGANLEYIRYALTQMIAPVLRWIVGMAGTILQYINSIVNALTGVNLFGKASAKSFQKMKSNATGTAKATKEMKKQLAGFDEANILSDDKDKGSSGGGEGVTAPSFNLEDTFKNLDIANLGIIAAEKINAALSNIPWDSIQEGARNIATGIANTLNDFIRTLDWSLVGDTIAQGLNTAIYFVQEFVNNFDFTQFGKAMGDLFFNAVHNIDWAALGNTIGNSIKGAFNTISSFIAQVDWAKLSKDLIKFISSIDYGGIANALFSALGSALGGIASFIGQLIKDAWQGIKDYFGYWIEQSRSEGGNLVLGILTGIGEAIANIGKWIYNNVFKPFTDGFKNAFGIHSPSTVMKEMGTFLIEGLKNGVTNIWNKVKSIFTNLKTNIVNIFKGTWTNIKAVFSPIVNFFTNIISKVINAFKKFGTKVGDTIGSAFKNVINKVLGAVESILNSPINALNGLIDTINQLPGVSIGRLSTFSLPRLKSGAIINIPNKGGLVGGGRAIAGESGQEGILPLTDAQAMETLGEIIGRNVVVNLTNITELDGRRLDRKMQTIRADRNFAYNG